MDQFNLFFVFSLLLSALVLVGGTALGAFIGASTRTLTRTAGAPIAAGLGLGSGLVAVVGTLFLVLFTLFVRLPVNLPFGLLAAGIAFGLVIALVTVDWSGTAFAGTFVGTLFTVAIAGITVLLNFGPFLRFIPPFLLGPVIFTLGTLYSLSLLLFLGFVAALAVRLLNQYVLNEQTVSATTPSTATGTDSTTSL